jgi:hypothetical protein
MPSANASQQSAHEYRFSVSPELIRSFKDPHIEGLHIHHAYVQARTFPHGKLPDDVNPRSHENPTGRVPEQIEDSLKEHPKWFHILNRGLLIVAQKAWYDNRSQTFHLLIGSPDEGGLGDGATTDRVLAKAKHMATLADFETLRDGEIPDHLKDAFVHVEVISGDVGDMLVKLTGARNTSNQVKEFALENLGGGFEWLKDVIEESDIRGRVRYRENDPQPVDIRTALALLTLFHPKWNEMSKEPVIAYTSKGAILDYYREAEWRTGFETLRPVVVEILRLFDYIHLKFPDQYEKYKNNQGIGSKLGARKEVRYANDKRKAFKLALTGAQTRYFIPDGWLYPLLGSFRMLLLFPKGPRGQVKWLTDPENFYDEHGHELVGDVVEQSESLGRNANATGKSRPLWNNLRKAMELHRMKLERDN